MIQSSVFDQMFVEQRNEEVGNGLERLQGTHKEHSSYGRGFHVMSRLSGKSA